MTYKYYFKYRLENGEKGTGSVCASDIESAKETAKNRFGAKIDFYDFTTNNEPCFTGLVTLIPNETEPAEADETETENEEEENTMMSELKKYVDGIRDELKALYELDITDEERDEREENGEPCSLYDYFSDVLDIEYTIDSRGEYLGARVYVTLGGPNVWIDTREGYVKGAWGTDRKESWIPSEINGEIDDIFREYYESIRG